MVKWESKRLGDLLLLANGLVLALVLNQLASLYFFRLDMTEEKRYTIKTPTKELLQELDDAVYIEVYLEGDLNAGFRRLRKAVKETLEEFRVYSNNKIHYSFVDPAAAMGQNPAAAIDNSWRRSTPSLAFTRLDGLDGVGGVGAVSNKKDMAECAKNSKKEPGGSFLSKTPSIWIELGSSSREMDVYCYK